MTINEQRIMTQPSANSAIDCTMQQMKGEEGTPGQHMIIIWAPGFDHKPCTINLI